jgi:hypothetical protein
MTQSPQDAASARISGVFSQKKTAKIGTGTTARKTEVVTYFLVCERDDGQLDVQALTADDQPFGPKKQIGRDELLANYFPEPQKTLARQVSALSPKEMEIQKAVARGDKFRKRGESFTASSSTQGPGSGHGQRARNFGIGLCYIARGERPRRGRSSSAWSIWTRLSRTSTSTCSTSSASTCARPECTTRLRNYYRRALDLSSDDENLPTTWPGPPSAARAM